MMRDLLRAGNVSDDLESLAGLGHSLQAKHFHRCCRPDIGYLFAAIIEHRADLTEDLADDERIADAQGALLNQGGSNGAAAAIEFRIHPDASSQTRGARFQIQN